MLLLAFSRTPDGLPLRSATVEATATDQEVQPLWRLLYPPEGSGVMTCSAPLGRRSGRGADSVLKKLGKNRLRNRPTLPKHMGRAKTGCGSLPHILSSAAHLRDRQAQARARPVLAGASTIRRGHFRRA